MELDLMEDQVFHFWYIRQKYKSFGGRYEFIGKD